MPTSTSDHQVKCLSRPPAPSNLVIGATYRCGERRREGQQHLMMVELVPTDDGVTTRIAEGYLREPFFEDVRPS